jgi:hypothetical protein
MKRMLKIVPVLLFLAGLASCELFNVDVDTTFSANMNIVVDQPMVKGTAEVYPFSGSVTLDPTEDEDVAQYAEKIVDVGVDGIVAEVTYVSDTDVAFLAGSTFTITDGTTTGTFELKEDWPIEVGSTVTLTDLGGFYDDVETILLEVHEFTVGKQVSP